MKSRGDLAENFTGRGVELGVARGDFSETILRRGKVERLWSIDRWGDHHDSEEYFKAASRLVASGAGFCVPLRMTFSEAAMFFPESSLDFIYLDGYAHTGQEGGKTLREWWPKLKRGGIFAGHDYHKAWQPTVDAVNAFVTEFRLDLNVTGDGDRYPSWWVVK